MPGAIKKQVPIRHYASQNSAGAWEIGHRKPPESGGRQLPASQEQESSCHNRARCLCPIAQAAPEQLKRKNGNRNNQQAAQGNKCTTLFRQAVPALPQTSE